MKKYRVVLVLLLVCIAGLSAGQSVKVLDLERGLSNNYAECIIQDKRGFIWIGTRDGLNRFDGESVVTYRKELPSTFIYSLLEHSSGKIYVGTLQGGLAVYEPEREVFTNLSDAPSYKASAGKDIYAMFEDSFGNTWIGSLQGLGLIPARQDTLIWYEKFSQSGLQSFLGFTQTADSTIWMATSDGVYKIVVDGQGPLKLKPEHVREAAEDAYVRDVTTDPRNRNTLWIASEESGIIRWSPGSKQRVVYPLEERLRQSPVWTLHADDSGIVWAGGIKNGLYSFDDKKDRFVSRGEVLGNWLSSRSISDILRDENGNLWLTSHGNGVCYADMTSYIPSLYFSAEDGTNDPIIVSSFAEDANGDILIGTDGQGVNRMNSGGVIRKILSTSNGLSSNTILGIIPEKDGGMWLATWQGGVNYVSPGNEVTVFSHEGNDPQGLRGNDVKSIRRDASGRIWMATHGAGVSVYSPKQNRFVHPAAILASFQQNAAQWGSTLLETRRGEWWIGSHTGLYRYANDTLHVYTAANQQGSLASSLVYTLFESRDGDVWAGTSNSLEKFDFSNGRFVNYTERYGVPGNVKCILEDDQGDIWFSTTNELIELNPKTKAVRRFDRSYNLQSGQFLECSCLRSAEGKFFFGGTGGFNSLWPDSLRERSTPTSLLFTDLLLFNRAQQPMGDVLEKAMPFTSEVTLAYDQNVVTFEFLSIDFAASHEKLYSYKLDEFDREWSPPSAARTATYTNLDPGQYTFYVRAVSPNGSTLAEKAILLRIVPPFWMTGWFKIVSFLVGVTLFSAFFLWRLHWSRQKRLALERVVSERTREVREKNALLEQQTRDLLEKNDSLMKQDEQIKEQSALLLSQRDLLQQSNTALSESVHTKDTLFSILAHDLRNPFTSVLGYSRLLNSEYDRYMDDDRKKLIENLYQSSASVYSLLEDLLMWSKSQQNVLSFDLQPRRFRELLEETFHLLEVEAQRKSVRLVIGNADDVIFYADPNMVKVILRNLLYNALRYSPVNGVVSAGFHITGSTLEVYIRDEGPGVEDVSSLFDVTLQHKQVRDHNHGLGLTLCKEFMRRHNGSIRVENNEGKGACFYLRFPESGPERIVASHDSRSEKMNFESSSYAADGVLKTVLVIEDDDELRWYVKQTLMPEYKVMEATNAGDAQSLLSQFSADIMICDLHMPGMSGLDFCQRVKADTMTSHIPFIILTAESAVAQKVSGFHFGADDYIVKPAAPEVLRARVHNLLESRRKLKEIYRKDITSDAISFTTNTLDEEFIRKVDRIIEDHIGDSDLNPDSLAAHMAMSRTSLYTKIKALTGESVSIYIRNVRLKESKVLLAGGRLNVSEVAYAVGFNQLSYFTSCFREAFGLTPTEFISGSRKNRDVTA